MKEPIKEPIKDNMTLDQYKRLNYATACEDCTHFIQETEKCTLGFPTEQFLRRNQMKDIELSGFMAFCRAIEID